MASTTLVHMATCFGWWKKVKLPATSGSEIFMNWRWSLVVQYRLCGGRRLRMVDICTRSMVHIRCSLTPFVRAESWCWVINLATRWWERMTRRSTYSIVRCNTFWPRQNIRYFTERDEITMMWAEGRRMKLSLMLMTAITVVPIRNKVSAASPPGHAGWRGPYAALLRSLNF